MKRFTLVFAAFAAAAVLTGCKGKPAETEVITEAPTTEAVTEAVTEPVTEAPVQTEPVVEDSMNKTRSLKGLVKASGTNSLTIQTERGKELTFDTTGADIQIANGIQTGNNVTILYKGKIEDTDTKGAKVLMIVDLKNGETPVTEGERMTEAEESDPNAGSGTIGGSIVDVNMDRLVILADDGDSYYFAMYGTDTTLVNGMKQDNYVTVEYTGDIYGPDLVAATAVYDTDPAGAEAAKIAGPTQEGEHTYVNGVLDDCTLGTVTLTTDDGDQLTFDMADATLSYVNGISAGNYITVECEGNVDVSDPTQVKVTAVYDYSEDGSAVSYQEDDGTTDDTVYEDGEAEDGSADTVIYDDNAEGDNTAA